MYKFYLFSQLTRGICMHRIQRQHSQRWPCPSHQILPCCSSHQQQNACTLNWGSANQGSHNLGVTKEEGEYHQIIFLFKAHHQTLRQM